MAISLREVLGWHCAARQLTDAEVTGITDDSRKVTPGSIFFCIEGKQFDGHAPAVRAIKNGALLVVTQRDLGLGNDMQLFARDTREAYALSCAAWFGNPAKELTMVGITGTNGKTTTAFLLKAIFEQAGLQTGLLGTVKTVIGRQERESTLTTPDSYTLHESLREMADAGCTHCVMEVSSQALDQKRVAGIAFAVAVFTNLTQDHLDYHGSFENYRSAKSVLFKQAGLCVLNQDDPSFSFFREHTNAVCRSFSVCDDRADYTAKNCKLSPGSVEYELVGNGVIGRIRYPVPGWFSVSNSLGAAVCALELGISLSAVREACAHTQVPGRLESVKNDKSFSVLLDYAHTPDALENVLSALRESVPREKGGGRLLCLFGCGGDRDKGKRPLMGAIAAKGSDLVFVTSDNPRSEEPQSIIRDILAGIPENAAHIRVEPDRKTAIACALKEAGPGDIVLLAGKGQETYQILQSGKIHFDEREIVREILDTIKGEGTVD